MKKIKSIFVIALILSLLLSFSVFAIDLPEPTSNFFVNDFADVIDAEDEEELMAIGASLYKQTTAQVVVVTVDSLDGYEVGEYALELGREWGVGSEETDNGVVLLMAVTDRKVTIQVGYGLEGAITDGKAGRILDSYAIPYLSQDDFSTGLTEAYKAITTAVYEEYGVTPEIDYDSNFYSVIDDEFIEDVGETLGTILIIMFIILFILYFIIRKKMPSLFGPVVTTGRGYRSGTSYHGGSFRGGGGGFRGGGGSFGGGGASRGF